MIQDIIQVLRDSKTTQIKGNYIRYSGRKLEGKCALGELACKSGKSVLKLDKQRDVIDKAFLLKTYGVDDIDLPFFTYQGKGWDFDYINMTTSIADVIVTLNDDYGLTFKQIADFLEATFDL